MTTVRTTWGRRLRILDFDIENRPLSYLGQDFTTAEITAIAWKFIGESGMRCYLLGRDDPASGLREFSGDAYATADMVTGHNIRKHDLKMVNGALMELGLPTLGPKLAHDTYMDLHRRSGISASQENLAGMLGIKAAKVGMNTVAWREANRLTAPGLVLTEQRVRGDVLQHIELRARLLELGMLRPPRIWKP